MAFSITDFKSNALSEGGYRPTLFEVQVNKNNVSQPFSYLCQATQVPAMTTGVIEVPYFGRKIKIAGDRSFAEWSTTVMIEESFNQRAAFEEWARLINDGPSNVREQFNEEYKTDLQILLYGKDGGVIRTYDLIGCWPSDVGTIELDWNTNDTIGVYTVTWSFDYMNPGRQTGLIGTLLGL